MRICIIKGCGKKHEGKGFCKNHYKSYLKYGNPLQVEINKTVRKAKSIQKVKKMTLMKSTKIRTLTSREGVCSVEGCKNPIKAKQMCDKHYARIRRKGTVEVEYERVEMYTIKECLVIGCTKKHKSHGYCNTHYKNYRDYGTPYLFKIIKKCGVDGCENKHEAKGLCMKHYRDWKKIVSKNTFLES